MSVLLGKTKVITEKIKKLVYKFLGREGHQNRLHEITEYIIGVIICLNVALIIVESVDADREYGSVTDIFRVSFFIFFLIEYMLRLWISDMVTYDGGHPLKSRIKYILMPGSIINLLALLPVMLGGMVVDFRIFRVLRLLRITQVKSLKRYTNVLTKVIKLKGAQLLSSLFIVLIFILVSSVVVYDLEHGVQPDVFENVLSGLWWSISAVTTIGYGDTYPITPLGRILGSFMSIFGVFLMAVPVGILTSGFFEISRNLDNETHKRRK